MNHDDNRQIFEDLADSHVDIKQFFHGDYDKILGDERHNIDYPCLWLETPEIPFSGDSDNLGYAFSNIFIILMNSPKDNIPRQEYNKVFTEQLAKEMIKKLVCNPDFISSNIMMYPLDNIDNNHDQGWRVEITMRPRNPFISTKDRFKSTIPKVSFSWTVAENGGTFTISVQNEMENGLTGLTYEYRIMKGIGSPLELLPPGENPTFTTNSPGFYIQLEVTTTDGIKRVASGSTVTGSAGCSHRFTYNPFS